MALCTRWCATLRQLYTCLSSDSPLSPLTMNAMLCAMLMRLDSAQLATLMKHQQRAVLPIPGIPYRFVHRAHLVSMLLSSNGLATSLQLSPSASSQDASKQWYQISNALYDACHSRIYLCLSRLRNLRRFLRRRVLAKRRLAVAMAVHPRLGCSSPLRTLDDDLLTQIIALATMLQ